MQQHVPVGHRMHDSGMSVAHLNNRQAEGFIKRRLDEGSSCIGNDAIHFPISDRIFLRYQPPVQQSTCVMSHIH